MLGPALTFLNGCFKARFKEMLLAEPCTQHIGKQLFRLEIRNFLSLIPCLELSSNSPSGQSISELAGMACAPRGFYLGAVATQQQRSTTGT